MRPLTRVMAWICLAALLGPSAPAGADQLGPGLDLKAGWAAPLSPQGPNSFSQSYDSALQPGLGLTLRFDPAWLIGLQGQWAGYQHASVANTALSTWALGLMGELDLDPEPLGPQDHLYLQLCLGGGGAQLSTPARFQSRRWNSFSASLAFGWERPLAAWTALLAEAQAWMLAGPGQADPIATASLSLGLRFGIPPRKKAQP